MFCLECGAEMTVRAQKCPVCGHVYGERERSLAEPAGGRATHAATGNQASNSSAPSSLTTAASPVAGAVSTVKYVGELGATGLPRDLAGRFVLGISLGMAADLLLPWVSVNNSNVTPGNIGAPAVVLVALLAAATLPVFTTSLRQHPVWSALPLIVGAFCMGIAGSIWLLLAPLAQIFATSFGSDPSNLALSPQGGLYLFLLGSAGLMISGQRMLATMHEAQLADARREAMRSLQQRRTASARVVAPPVPAPESLAPVARQPQGALADGVSPMPTPAVSPVYPAYPAIPAITASSAESSTSAAPAAETTTAPAPVAPVLPGSEAWHQAPAAPTPQRPAPGSGWGKSRGPQRLR